MTVSFIVASAIALALSDGATTLDDVEPAGRLAVAMATIVGALVFATRLPWPRRRELNPEYRSERLQIPPVT